MYMRQPPSRVFPKSIATNIAVSPLKLFLVSRASVIRTDSYLSVYASRHSACALSIIQRALNRDNESG